MRTVDSNIAKRFLQIANLEIGGIRTARSIRDDALAPASPNTVYSSARKRGFERRLDVLPACDLAADITDQPAEPGAQDAQLSTVTVELFGMGIWENLFRELAG